MFCSDKIKKLGYSLASKDIEVDEDLPNFFNVIPRRNARHATVEDEYVQDTFGVQLENP